MTTDTKPTRTTLFLATCAVFCVIAAAGLRTIRPINANLNDPTLDALNAQMRELAPFNTPALNRAKEVRAAAEEKLWTTEKLNAWRQTVPKEWRVQEAASVPAVFTTQRRFLLSSPAATFRAWPDIVAFLNATAESPAMRIHSLNITAPPGSKRAFTQLNMLIGFSSPKNPAKSAPSTP
jgi:hypothetical protein